MGIGSANSAVRLLRYGECGFSPAQRMPFPELGHARRCVDLMTRSVFGPQQ